MVFLSSEIRNSETPLSFQLIVKTVNVFNSYRSRTILPFDSYQKKNICSKCFFAFLFAAERTFFWSLLQQDLSDH
jgi:hypothetical protein